MMLLADLASPQKSRRVIIPLQQCMKWCVSDPKNRTISPFSKLTVGEWIENRIKEGAVDDLQAASSEQ
jgi:hypothetical protein